jgi:hypothetical protein
MSWPSATDEWRYKATEALYAIDVVCEQESIAVGNSIVAQSQDCNLCHTQQIHACYPHTITVAGVVTYFHTREDMLDRLRALYENKYKAIEERLRAAVEREKKPASAYSGSASRALSYLSAIAPTTFELTAFYSVYTQSHVYLTPAIMPEIRFEFELDTNIRSLNWDVVQEIERRMRRVKEILTRE